MNHIDILQDQDCCGCNACKQICPKDCINLKKDKKGFKYPKVNEKNCINCGLCRKVCPFLNINKSDRITYAYAGINPNESIRIISSSGGIFNALAEDIIESGGVVFGAMFDSEWNIVHSYSDNKKTLTKLLGSKYVQSEIGDSFIECKRFLENGYKVLFTGTPCQISALKKYLRKDYSTLLLTVEIICHGVPSPGIWQDYLHAMHNYDQISSIDFRSKLLSWEQFGMKIDFRDGTKYFRKASEDLFINGFLKNLYLRPSCYKCKVKNGSSHADISLGDFWGIENIISNINDHKGISLILCHNNKGRFAIKELNLKLVPVNLTNAIAYNSAYTHSVDYPYQSTLFWRQYLKKGILCLPKLLALYKPTLKNRILNRIYSFITKYN